MPTYTGYYIGRAGHTYYAKPVPTASISWSGDIVLGVRNGTTNEIAFTLDVNRQYWVYEQENSAPASTDTVVSSFEYGACKDTQDGSGSTSQVELRAQLKDIEAKLNSGVTSVTVDGTTTQINHAFLRKRANELRKRIASENGRRPVASSIYLGGF